MNNDTKNGCLSKRVFSNGSSKSICITSNGCSENRMDCAKMQEFFIRNGWSVTSDLRDADYIFFNACGLTTLREDTSLKTLQRINDQKKHSAEVIVWGCFPKINYDRIRATHKGVIFSRDEAQRLDELFEGNIRARDIRANYLAIPSKNLITKPNTLSECLSKYFRIQNYLSKLITNHHWGHAQNQVSFVDHDAYFIKASTGCLNACTFCGVRFSRGKLRSEPLSTVNEEFKKGLREGFRKFILIGTDLGAYGRDQGDNLVDLLSCLLKSNGDYKLRLPNVNPRWLIEMMPELRALVRTEKIEVIGCGVQSGSNRILRLMNRGHTIEDYKEAIFALKMEFASLRIRTNILVGFPGETALDFQETIRLVNEVGFTFADIHRYSPRPGSKAALLPDQIPRAVVEVRHWRLLRSFNRRLHKNNLG